MSGLKNRGPELGGGPRKMPVPPAVKRAKDAREVLSVWIADTQAQVILQAFTDNSERVVEAAQDQPVEAETLEHHLPGRRPGQAEHRLVGSEEGARMRLEGQGHGRARGLAGLLPHRADQRPVAAMHAIEIADRDQPAMQRCRQSPRPFDPADARRHGDQRSFGMTATGANPWPSRNAARRSGSGSSGWPYSRAWTPPET